MLTLVVNSLYRNFFLVVSAIFLTFLSLNVSGQLVGHERWSGKDYYVVELVHGRTIEIGSVLKIVDFETSEVFDANVLSVGNMGIDLELELYRADHNVHFFLEVPLDGIDVIQR